MRNRLTMWLACFLLAFLSACVSKARFETVTNDYQLSQQALQKSEAEKEQCRQDNVELLNQIEVSRNENADLAANSDTLNQTIKEKDKIISLQSTFIRLFDDSKKTIQTSIKDQIAEQKLQPSDSTLPVRVLLVNNLVFESGNANLSADGKDLLRKLTVLAQEERHTKIRVQGHTDDRPLKSTSMYATNWELSAARATAVVHFLQENVGVDPERISATGFGQYQPVASNETDEGRRQNRRIEIVIESAK